MSSPNSTYSDRYIPANTNGGWGAIGFVIFLVIVCIATATYIHKKTWKNPADPTYEGIRTEAVEH